MTQPGTDAIWEPILPAEVAKLFTNLPAPWWIAGGWAIDLFLGHQSRSHGDLDVLVLRRDQGVIFDRLVGWDLYACDPPGSLRPWRSRDWLPVGIHDIWCRRGPDLPWSMQIMLMEQDDDQWVFRRDVRIRGPIDSIGLTSSAGIPILRPEIQLLFKATSSIREKDLADFEAVLPRLDPAARDWLHRALEMTAPGHRWKIK